MITNIHPLLERMKLKKLEYQNEEEMYNDHIQVVVSHHLLVLRLFFWRTVWSANVASRQFRSISLKSNGGYERIIRIFALCA